MYKILEVEKLLNYGQLQLVSISTGTSASANCKEYESKVMHSIVLIISFDSPQRIMKIASFVGIGMWWWCMVVDVDEYGDHHHEY